jgi:hypothetical protein
MSKELKTWPDAVMFLYEKIKKMRPLAGDNTSITETAEGIRINSQAAGIGGGSSDYNGYFKVVKSGENLAVVDGADPSATIAGYTKAGNVRIAVNKAEIDVSQQGYIYIETTYEYSYKCEIKYTASFNVPPDSDGKHIRIIADYSDYGNKIIQRLYGENEITGKWV